MLLCPEQIESKTQAHTPEKYPLKTAQFDRQVASVKFIAMRMSLYSFALWAADVQKRPCWSLLTVAAWRNPTGQVKPHTLPMSALKLWTGLLWHQALALAMKSNRSQIQPTVILMPWRRICVKNELRYELCCSSRYHHICITPPSPLTQPCFEGALCAWIGRFLMLPKIVHDGSQPRLASIGLFSPAWDLVPWP